MILQASKGLNSRNDANPYNNDGFLPLMTAPMYSVVDDKNYQIFLDNKIQVCLPRGLNKNRNNFETSYPMFVSLSLKEFKEQYIDNNSKISGFSQKICIDTANGNMPELHDAIRKAKQIHGDNLIIIAGNVGSSDAFFELAKTGVDYIRVGIGGGGGCNTTSNTGVGQNDLRKLIKEISEIINLNRRHYKIYAKNLTDKPKFDIRNVKIIADGISSFVKYCEKEYNFNDNGYAAINTLLNEGADIVMIGSLFAQCLESAGEKKFNHWSLHPNLTIEEWKKLKQGLFVKYAGMSTTEEQIKYKSDLKIHDHISDRLIPVSEIEKGIGKNTHIYNLKPSEGSVKWIPIRWTLDEWLNGSENQDEAPYLMGWINSVKSMMSYTGKTTLS